MSYIKISLLIFLLGLVSALSYNNLRLETKIQSLREEAALCKVNLESQNNKIKSMRIDVESFKSKIELQNKEIELRYLKQSKSQVKSCEDAIRILNDALEVFYAPRNTVTAN